LESEAPIARSLNALDISVLDGELVVVGPAQTFTVSIMDSGPRLVVAVLNVVARANGDAVRLFDGGLFLNLWPCPAVVGPAGARPTVSGAVGASTRGYLTYPLPDLERETLLGVCAASSLLVTLSSSSAGLTRRWIRLAKAPEIHKVEVEAHASAHVPDLVSLAAGKVLVNPGNAVLGLAFNNACLPAPLDDATVAGDARLTSVAGDPVLVEGHDAHLIHYG
jgi:hypothetical protein